MAESAFYPTTFYLQISELETQSLGFETQSYPAKIFVDYICKQNEIL